MKGWAKLQQCIYELKRDEELSIDEVHRLLRYALGRNIFMGYMERRTHGKNRATNFRS